MLKELANIMKVGDVISTRLSEPTLNYLLRQDPAYYDNLLKEHQYNISDMLEGSEVDDAIPDDVLPELKQIHELLGKSDCAYLRITFS